eukprot:3674170-Prymnesium_polylepis.1
MPTVVPFEGSLTVLPESRGADSTGRRRGGGRSVSTPGGARPGRRPEAPKPPAPPSLNLDLAAANSAADIARQAAVAAHIGAA